MTREELLLLDGHQHACRAARLGVVTVGHRRDVYERVRRLLP